MDREPALLQPASSSGNPLRRSLRWAAVLVAAGALLTAAVLPTRMLLVPSALQPATHAVYRVAFWLVLPGRMVLAPVNGRIVQAVGPVAAHAAGAFAAPWVCAAISGAVFLARRRRTWAVPAPDEAPSPRPPDESPASPSRRRALGQAAAGFTILCSGGLGAHATLVAPGRVAVRRRKLLIRDLPEGLRGFVIAHVSDTHYGPFIPLPHLRRVIGMVNSLGANFIALTGDYVHQTPRAIPEGIGILADLRSRLGAAAVLGNHDHWEGAEACRERFASAGIPLLDNRRLFLSASGLRPDPLPGETICLGGLGDLWEDESDFEAATRDAPPDMPRILLSHNPDTAEHAPRDIRVDLMLSGHTHGGQVAFPVLGTPIVPSSYGAKYAGGLCSGPFHPVLVSRGIGMAALPLRFNVPPEIPLLELDRDDSARGNPPDA